MNEDRDAAVSNREGASSATTALVVPGSALPTAPVVVRNELWSAADPAAYNGGRASEITHLSEVEASGIASRDDARWSGALEIIPTKADIVLDL
ncbi:MAG: hypothetical protein ACRDGQ_09995, partial [Candidatus Limnocylindrales bacterium]